MNKRVLVRGVLLFLALVLLSTSLFSLASSNSASTAEIEPEVLQALENNVEVPVIVLLKEETVAESSGLTLAENLASRNREVSVEKKSRIRQQEEQVLGRLRVKENPKERGAPSEMLVSEGTPQVEPTPDLELRHKYVTFSGFSGKLTKEGLEKLSRDPSVEKISFDNQIKPTLSGSIPLINADEAWNVSVSGLKINGTGESVCVIDTGVDYTHPALGGCNNNSFLNGSCAKVISGWDYGNDDADPFPSGSYSSNNHGTHVAGIVASMNETYKGVAPGARIVALKVFTDSGSGSDSDLTAAIDWCVANKTVFNISVITMSLAECSGSPCTELIFTSNCDSRTLASESNYAASQGIFVDASAGNLGNTTGITSPACGSNVTSVGSVTKSDGISGYNSASFMDLLAPGSSITSTVLSGSFDTKSGTSMAAPHVAGAAAVLTQYWKTAYGHAPTPAQVRSRLKNSGTLINDTRNGILFPRVDVFKALQPYLNFTFANPTNNSYLKATFTINFTSDVNLSSALLEWNFGNGTVQNITMNQSTPVNWYYVFNLSSGNYSYRIYGNDSANNFGTTELRKLQIDVLPPRIQLNAPANGTTLNNSLVSFNWTAIDEMDANLTCNLTFNNAVNLSNQPSLNNTAINYSVNLSENAYVWNVTCWDDLNNTNVSETRTFWVNSAAPNITIITPSNNSYFRAPFNLNISLSDVLLSTSSYNISNSSSNVVQSNSSGLINASSFSWGELINISNSTFAEGNYTFSVFANDSTGSSANLAYLFIVDRTAPAILGMERTPETVYNNDTALFSVNASDTNLNTSKIFLEGNWTGNWSNYTMTLESPSRFNFSVSGNTNLTNQRNMGYRFHAFDLAGNVNSSALFNFTVQNRVPTDLNITAPGNNSILEVGNFTTFRSRITDLDQDTLTYTWLFGNSYNVTSSTAQNTSFQYNTTGNYNLTLIVSDGYNSTNLTYLLTINDTLPPNVTLNNQVSSIRRGNNYTINATLFDWSNISLARLIFNNTTYNTTSQNGNLYVWIINSSLLSTDGTKSYTINVTDNFTTTHNGLYNSTFTVTSCSDGTQNGDETGTDCGGSCSACSSSSSSGGGSSSSSGGGITPTSTTITPATETPKAAETPKSSGSSAEEKKSEVLQVSEEPKTTALTPAATEKALKKKGLALVGQAIGNTLKSAVSNWKTSLIFLGSLILLILAIIIVFQHQRRRAQEGNDF